MNVADECDEFLQSKALALIRSHFAVDRVDIFSSLHQLDELLKFGEIQAAGLRDVGFGKLGANRAGGDVDMEIVAAQSLDGHHVNLFLIFRMRPLGELLVHLLAPIGPHGLLVEGGEGGHEVMTVLGYRVQRRDPEIHHLLVVGDQMHGLLRPAFGLVGDGVDNREEA